MDTSFLKSKNAYIIGLTILLMVGGFLFLKPQWQAFSDTKVKLNGLIAEETRLKEIKNKYQLFLKGYNDHLTDKDRANQALPIKEANLPDMLNNIEQLAQASGMSLEEIGFESPGAGELKDKKAVENSIQVMPMTIRATGSYAALQNFLTRVESYLRLIDVLGIDIQAPEATAINYQIRLQVYYQK